MATAENVIIEQNSHVIERRSNKSSLICFGSSTAQQTGFLFDPTIDLWLLLGFEFTHTSYNQSETLQALTLLHATIILKKLKLTLHSFL